ncbi:hypothetical protein METBISCDRAFT_29071 [Metschnikowia bicuspidata]|uniref:Rap-GAP domain-containing protein n=1 Tax=Metschnikowia bicuspidata TaxID=27322 RepID=A0A4P9Z8G7_9ASCO|nr:hypothetical protein METBISCDRAFT_29071 [Metschnikowia bicuspidata]
MNIVIFPPNTFYYRVKTYRRSEMPGILSASHYKLSSQEQLPHFVCNSVLMASRFARVWHELADSAYLTNWAQRARQLRALRERAIAAQQTLAKYQAGDEHASAPPTLLLSLLVQLQALDVPAVGGLLLADASLCKRCRCH